MRQARLETWQFATLPKGANEFSGWETYYIGVYRKPSSTKVWREMNRVLNEGKVDKIKYCIAP
jgi:hypothetical protein